MNTSPKLLIITIVGLFAYWSIASVLYVVIAYDNNAGVYYSQEFKDYFGIAIVYLVPVLLNPVTLQLDFNTFQVLPSMTFAIVITSGISLAWIAYGTFRLVKRVNRFRNKVNKLSKE